MQHIHLDKIPSTQTHILENFQEAPRHLLVSCEEQLAGMGRRGNQWDSYQESLCFSFTISPTKTLSLSSIEISLLITRYFKETFNKELQLKWPNDIMIKNKKCGGLIINNSKSNQLIVGVGLNISPIENIIKYSIAADSIFETDMIFSKRNMAAKIYRYCLDNRMSPIAIENSWPDYCCHTDKAVTIKDETNEIEGLFIGIGNQGQALIRTSQGTQEFFSGSLRF